MDQRSYVNVLEWLVISCLAVMVGITFISTAIRYLVPGMGGIYWAEEVTRYVSIWMIFLVSGLAVRYGVHLHVDLVTAQLPPHVQRVLLIFVCVLMLVFEGVLVYFGTVVAVSNMAQQSSSLELPMGYVYAAIPVGGALMIFESLRALLAAIRGPGKPNGASPPEFHLSVD